MLTPAAVPGAHPPLDDESTFITFAGVKFSVPAEEVPATKGTKEKLDPVNSLRALVSAIEPKYKKAKFSCAPLFISSDRQNRARMVTYFVQKMNEIIGDENKRLADPGVAIATHEDCRDHVKQVVVGLRSWSVIVEAENIAFEPTKNLLGQIPAHASDDDRFATQNQKAMWKKFVAEKLWPVQVKKWKEQNEKKRKKRAREAMESAQAGDAPAGDAPESSSDSNKKACPSREH
jgi:hypothetical protein